MLFPPLERRTIPQVAVRLSSQMSSTTDLSRVLRQTRTFFNQPRNRARVSSRPIDKFAFDEIVKLIPKGSEEQTALDLGCHWGRISAWLAGTYGRVIGVDFAEKAIESAERRHNIEYYCLDLNTSAEQLGVFGEVDLIVAVAVFEMIENPQALSRQLARVAKKSCKVLVVIPNRRSINYGVFRSALWVSRNLLRRPRQIHNNGLSIQQLEDCFVKAGFQVLAKGSVVGIPLYLAGLLPSVLQASFLKLDHWFLTLLGGSYHWICCQPEVEE
jgi:2-polyprenyl-3-methyl-5-hydroxy-6-metoxy-1,4-benzoquinol methylase